MRQLFKIDESEKKRILEMHENATKKNYLMEQGTPPPAAAAPAATGTQIMGKTYKMEKIKDEATLNQFINWGVLPSKPEAKTNTRHMDTTMANEIGFAFTPGSDLPEKPAGDVDSGPVAKMKQIFQDLDLIAQTHTLAQVCRGFSPKPGPKLEWPELSKTIAKNRANKLGWCFGMG